MGRSDLVNFGEDKIKKTYGFSQNKIKFKKLSKIKSFNSSF